MNHDAAMVSDTVKFARSLERLTATLTPLKLIVESADRVVKLDPELEPEMTTVLAQLGEIQDTIERASAFVIARFLAKYPEADPDA